MKELLPWLPRPSHFLGSEINSVHKDPDNVHLRIGLAFPDVYEVGMSYLGQKILYSQVNRQEGFQAERVFAPSAEAGQIIRDRGGTLCTLESDTRVMDLDILAFSLTHELCYTNILYMLDLAGIPFKSRDRNEDHPLIMAGGGAVFNAEPVADFFDLMVLGDGEELIVQAGRAVLESRQAGRSRGELLQRLSLIQGIYVPAFLSSACAGSEVKKAVITDLNQVHFPENQIVPFGKIVHDRLSVEIARGCTRGCRFCQAGSIYRPVRERNVSSLLSIIQAGLRQTGLEELSFLSLSAGDFSALEYLFDHAFAGCRREQVAMALPSLRVGSVNEHLMELMARIRRTHATLAPEAGTQRLRDVINKGITEEELLAHTRTLFSLGWNSVKFYFMIGLPTEDEEDLAGIRDLCLKVLETSRAAGMKKVQITASISPFVPKSHTPFQWEKQAGLEEVREKIRLLRRMFNSHKKLNLKWHDPEMSALEGIFSRGGRELSGVVEKAFLRGQIFTSWSDHFELGPWLEILKDQGLDMDQYLGARKTDQVLPWDHLDCGVSRDFLLAERSRAMTGRITQDCRYAACRGCGVCDTDKKASRLSQGQGKEKIRNILNSRVRDQEGPGRAVSHESSDLYSKNHHYRIWYEKTGPAVYLSQLEIQSVFERAMRRCGWPLSFSKGFRPMPLISFGMALSVGVASLEEWYNFYTCRPLEESAMLKELNRQLPAGMKAFDVQMLSLGRRQAQAGAEEFCLEFSEKEHGSGRYKELWDNFLAEKEFTVSRQGKKKTVTRDLKKMVKSGNWQGSRFHCVLDWSEDYLSPLFIFQSIFPGAWPESMSITKVRQIGAWGGIKK